MGIVCEYCGGGEPGKCGLDVGESVERVWGECVDIVDRVWRYCG